MCSSQDLASTKSSLRLKTPDSKIARASDVFQLPPNVAGCQEGSLGFY
jgi:hypothetical protein